LYKKEAKIIVKKVEVYNQLIINLTKIFQRALRKKEIRWKF
jgi:hypothetical protein